jgi:hypothetical protein
VLFTVESAKQFLLSKLQDQASRDGVALADVEKRRFLFSETSDSSDTDAQEEFDRTCDSGAYEAKLAKLLREAHARDKRNTERRKEWQQALKTLRSEDFYGLVMVDQAGIPRVDASWWAIMLDGLPLALTELAIFALYWFVVMRDSGIMRAMPDWVRIVAVLPFAALCWYAPSLFENTGLLRHVQRPGRDTDKNS